MFFAAVAAFLAVGLMLGGFTLRLVGYSGEQSRSRKIIIQTNLLASTLIDAEVGQRGYMLTGNKSYLEPYEQALARTDTVLNTLAALTSGNAVQQAYIIGLRPLIANKLTELAATIRAFDTEGPDAARAIVLTDQGKLTMDQIRGLTTMMAQDETAVLDGRTTGLTSTITGILLFSLLIVGLGLALFSSAYLALRRALLTRVQVEARLVSRERDLTIENERRRFARDLHDAISQSLFSATLTAEMLPTLLKNKPAEAQKAIENLHRMTKGAQAEMRTLLFDLRPEALTQTDLTTLLEHLVEASRPRSDAQLTLEIDGEGTFPPDVQIAFYRITQEALNNALKYSRANVISVYFMRAKESACVEVRDDGVGFDLASAPPDHFGLRNMRERAAQIDARFTINSSPGRGTHMMLEWPNPNHRSTSNTPESLA